LGRQERAAQERFLFRRGVSRLGFVGQRRHAECQPYREGRGPAETRYCESSHHLASPGVSLMVSRSFFRLTSMVVSTPAFRLSERRWKSAALRTISPPIETTMSSVFNPALAAALPGSTRSMSAGLLRPPRLKSRMPSSPFALDFEFTV